MKRIVVERLTKVYESLAQQERQKNFRGLLRSQISSLFGTNEQKAEFRALDDISFDVEEGQVLGIMGKNGSGKSTLLKILSKITAPTSGRVVLRGHVASLLEVGTGFHAELSGRENIYLSGIILGMKRWEIQKQFDAIVSFSSVERFLDVPVKKYSSGMRLRLAFAVAVHLQPEILLVDEVLAVGDYEFEKKCHKEIDSLKSTGRTILFVSHSMVAIQKFSSKCLVLAQGKVAFVGNPRDAVSKYLLTSDTAKGSIVWTDEDCPQDDIVKIKSIAITDKEGSSKLLFFNDEKIIIRISYEALKNDERFSVMLWFYNERGDLIFISLDTTNEEWSFRPREKGSYESICEVPPHFFSAGIIHITLKVVSVKTGWDFVLHEVVSLNIADMYDRKVIGDWIWEWPRTIISPSVTWKIFQL